MNYQDVCPSFAVSAVDVHGHCGPNFPKGKDNPEPYGNGSAEIVAQRARQSNIRWTIVSATQTFYPEGRADVIAGNIKTAQAVECTEGLLQWAVLDPLTPQSFDQVSDMAQNPRCAGIKIHPEMHKYNIRDHGERIFEFAARYNLLIITHSGESLSLPQDFVPFANAFAEVRLILAHLGCSFDEDLTRQIRAVQMSKNGNIHVDTSSMRNIHPDLLEYAVAEIGADRLLFGSDTPLYFLPMQRARIDWAEISEHNKRKILNDNAVKLLGDIVA